MTYQSEGSFDLSQLPLLIDTIPIGITIVDLKGYILFYNKYSSQILDRKPEYIGRDIRDCHKNPASNEKIDHMLDEFRKGRKHEFGYETIRDGKHIAVKFSPLIVEEKIAACVQTVIIK